jgi:hypothetical protein
MSEARQEQKRSHGYEALTAVDVSPLAAQHNHKEAAARTEKDYQVITDYELGNTAALTGEKKQ